MGGVGFGTLTLTQTNQDNCSASTQICIEVIARPSARFAAIGFEGSEHITVCRNQLIHFQDLAGASGGSPLENWHWNFGDGTSYSTSTSMPASHAYSVGGNYTITFTVKNQCNCTDEMVLNVTVLEDENVSIECPSVVCEYNTTTYSIPGIACGEAGEWTVLGGNITTQNGASIEVSWDNVDESGFGFVQFNSSKCAVKYGGITTIKVPVVQQKGTIKGANIVCNNSQQVYRLPAWPGVAFNWTITGSVSGSITPLYTDQPNEVVIKPTQNETITIECNYYSSLLDCGGNASFSVEVQNPSVLTGPISSCQGSNVQYSLAGATGSWNWVIKSPNGSSQIINGVGNNPYSINNLSVGLYTIGIQTNDFCIPEPIQLVVTNGPEKVDKIGGPNEVCPNVSYTYSAGYILANHNFVWTVVSGTATLVGNTTGSTVVVNFTGNGPWQIGVQRINLQNPGCTSTILTKNVVKAVVPNSVISGFNEVCPNTYVNYSSTYAEGETYEWSIVPAVAGSVVTGNGTKNIQVLWNNNSANTPKEVRVEIRKCGLLYVRTLNVNVGVTPTIALSYPSTVCRDEPITFTATLTPSLPSPVFLWTFGDGSILVGNSPITHTYTALSTTLTNYPISVKLLSYTGCNSVTQVTEDGTINVNPSPVISISPAGQYIQCSNPVVPLTATLQTGYGTTTQIEWFTPSGSSICATPFTGCNPFNTAQYGVHYAVATNSNGCTSKSAEVEIVDCPPICGTGIAPPNVTITSNSCGTVSLTGTYTTTPTPVQINWTVLNGTANNISSSSTSWQGSFTQAGNYAVKYAVVYNLHGIMCSKEFVANIAIPLLPKFLTTTSCGTGNNYNVTINNSSPYLPGTIFNTYTYYLYDAAGTTLLQSQTVTHPPTNSHSFNLAAGNTYQIKMAVNYTYNGITETCITAAETLTLPAKPVANFTFNSNYRCEGVPVVFSSSNTTPITGLTYHWAFGDAATSLVTNPSRVYQAAIHPVTLTVTNEHGCTASQLQNISITENELRNQTSLSPNVPSFICEGSSQTLQHINGSLITPTSYRWIQAPSTTIAQTNHPTNSYAVYETGQYWVRVEDANKCYDNTPAVSVTTIPLLTPVIEGKNTQCANQPFSLTAFVGNTSQITYQWYRNGTAITMPNSYTLTEEAGLPVGTYTYSVTTFITQNSITCNKQSANFIVNVIAPPAAPFINASLVNCNAYELQLSASPVLAGSYSWSNGQNGNTIQVNKGGFYKLWFTLGSTGCSSSTEIQVDKDPQGYTWVVPTGCYTRCLPEDPINNPILINGPIQPFSYWQWNINANPFINGQNSVVQPLQIMGPGNYGLLLQNSFGCQAQSGNLQFSLPEECTPQEIACNIETSLDLVSVQPNDNGTCTATLVLTINSYNNLPIAYSLVSPNGGTLIQAGGIAPAGTPTTQNIQFTVPNSGNYPIRLIFWLPIADDGSEPCEFWFDVEVNCDAGRFVHNAKKVKAKHSPSPTNTSPSKTTVIKQPIYSLQLKPNPAIGQSTTAVYTYTPVLGKKYTVEVFSSMGVLIQQYKLQDKTNTLRVQLPNQAKGMYWVVLKENGIVKAKQQLMIIE
jgi:PKD repeat protein